MRPRHAGSRVPKTGIDPDVCVLSPAPNDFDSLSSLRLWEPKRVPPLLCVEVVSASHPHKDYAEIHERYAEKERERAAREAMERRVRKLELAISRSQKTR